MGSPRSGRVGFGAQPRLSDKPVTCRELTDFIADYLSGETPPDSRREFERHLEICPNCVTYLRGYEETVRLGRLAFDDEEATVPDTVPDELVEAVLSARSKSNAE